MQQHENRLSHDSSRRSTPEEILTIPNVVASLVPMRTLNDFQTRSAESRLSELKYKYEASLCYLHRRNAQV